MAKRVNLLDVTARDGLQNEAIHFSTKDKIKLINKVIASGVKRLEVASFVHPRAVPQMADAEDVIASLSDETGVTRIGLAMNELGVDRALSTGVEEIGLVVVATDTFAQRNQNQTRQGSVDLACALIDKVKGEGRAVNVTIAAAFGCPFEGEVDRPRIAKMASQLAESGPGEISLADTIGVGDPWRVKALFGTVKNEIGEIPLRAHFHNTRNTGLANVYAALEAGVATLDVSVGGIGGCPFAPAATGNVPAEDVLYMLQRNGIDTGINLDETVETAKWLTQKMGKSLPGMVSKAGGFPPPAKAVSAEAL